ncbi:hypothetical protein SAMN04487944_1042 [Gracilibacillus ureilyticus]|uniref:RNA-directed DNA polymerase n=1 Tax=Gracilibacillus ureilyticus TaxID=531814 RepID=A0A1H9NXK7_9BACI|nr:hypothetical protein SAMN04487944_1042 [Gracilibacillus ureilyticus]
MYERTLLEKILDTDNLNRAIQQVKRNKGAAGVDGRECNINCVSKRAYGSYFAVYFFIVKL